MALRPNPSLKRSATLLIAAGSSLFAPLGIATPTAQKFRIYHVAALIPPSKMPREAQLDVLKQCKSQNVDAATAPQSSREDMKLLRGRSSIEFFANGFPQLAEAWYPGALVDTSGSHATPGVTAAVADAFVICFLKKGYKYGTFKQKLISR